MLRFNCPHREERYTSFRPFGSRLAVVALIGLASLGATVARGQAPVTQPALIARAVLPADTFAEGPRSGTRIDPPANNGRVAPFDRQPGQGISGILNGGDGTFLVLEDNGYGAKANSPDFNLRVYRVRPNWKTAQGGAGTVEVVGRHVVYAGSRPDAASGGGRARAGLVRGRGSGAAAAGRRLLTAGRIVEGRGGLPATGPRHPASSVPLESAEVTSWHCTRSPNAR